jgi:tetratricopeptide (TPR) repeat protein
MDGDLSSIGSGFFIDNKGTLVTNYHVLEGAYMAVVKTAAGKKYPIESVIAQNQLVDLMKVRVLIPAELTVPVTLSDEAPAVADRVVVIGSPMGFEQTISEGIISAVREHPSSGEVYQVTAPISKGSSGGPAVNFRGEVVGIVTFQATRGQNLNFAVSTKTLGRLANEPEKLSVAEWTLKKSANDPRIAASLCSRGAQLSIEGNYEEALDYFQKATEINPEDPYAWHGLGNCYIGLDQPDDAIEAYNQSIVVDPENPTPHYMLAMFYNSLGQYEDAVASLLRVITIDPDNLQARYELARTYGKLEYTHEQIDAFEAVLDINPDHVPSLHLMAQAARRIGLYDKALEALLKASTIEPENALIYFDIGVTYHYKALPEKEMRAYARAIAADPRLVGPHYNIGILFIQQGNRKLALDQYAILKSLDEDTAKKLFVQIYPEKLADFEPAPLLEQ